MPRLPKHVTRVVLPSGAIRFEVRPAGLDPVTGERVQFRRRFETVDDATEFYVQITGEPVKGAQRADKSRGGRTFQQEADAWRESLRKKSQSTLDGYYYDLKRAMPFIGSKRVRDLTDTDIEDMVTALLGQGYVESTVDATLMQVRQVLRWLVRRKQLSDNAAEHVEGPKVSRDHYDGLRDAIPDADLAAIYAVIDQDRFGHLWRLALLGLRRSELAGLRWRDVDLDADPPTIGVEVPRTAVRGGAAESDGKNATSIRTLPLPREEAETLRAAWDRKQADIERQGRRYRPTDLLAVSVGGVPRNPSTLSKDWATFLRDHGIPHTRLHDARHTAASSMLARGVDPATVAAWLGHANARTTLAVYAHSNPQRLAAVAEGFHTKPEPETKHGGGPPIDR